ncbi:hypothetical protein AB7M45_007822 [Bradyrhizobium elkanii]|uniref:hypothetical protein n=1 Tax=Bradyrhizobium elkanii TaxID=29448 RepID=UPI00091E3D9A|nr:hypothetical protein [Bradyrhizobium elkanii]MCW2195049.1 hypothetical protein [Bradyrhizobium elkanii]NWL67256.1 hypothetical protein [Bradyrhizobium elkanii]OIM94081.1 hypothetical protein BLN97_12470 [Bradyrhizobium elkanii]
MIDTKASKATAKRKPASRAFASADTSLRISAAEFRTWQEGAGLSNAAAARLLYVAENTLAQYRANGAGPDIARQIWAIIAGIRPDTGRQRAELLGRINAALDG